MHTAIRYFQVVFLLSGSSSCQCFRVLTLLLADNSHVEKYHFTIVWQSHHIDIGLGRVTDRQCTLKQRPLSVNPFSFAHTNTSLYIFF